MTADLSTATRMFQSASDYVAEAGLLAEVEWQRRVTLDDFTESDVLREMAWVVLCSGFRESVVRKVFDYISLCFCDWESAEAIIDSDPACRIAALASFGNESKINAIVQAAYLVQEQGFEYFKAAVVLNPLVELRRLPFIGPITVFHLAKNLGLDVAKPDRHLNRVADRLGFADADHLCTEIARVTGEQRNVVDILIWRYVADGHYVAESGLLNS